MNETLLFILTIVAVGTMGICGIIKGYKNTALELLAKEETDSIRGLVSCMIMASHMAQFVRGGVHLNRLFSYGEQSAFQRFLCFQDTAIISRRNKTGQV